MTINRVKAAITDIAMSQKQIAAALNLSPSFVCKAIKWLRSGELARQVHIESWHDAQGRFRRIAMYRAGNLPDAIHPLIEEIKREEKRRQAAAKKAEQERLKSAGKVLIAANDPCSFWVLRKEA